jgi:hypothetical protein
LVLNLNASIKAVDKYGALLVFAVKNKKFIPSLWSHFFPRSEMRWEWDDQGDNRVAKLWHLREKLSSSRRIVYSKWFRGRATLLSKSLLPALLRYLNGDHLNDFSLTSESLKLLKYLEENSPLSTKQLKNLSGLKGKEFESEYTRSLNALWSRLLIVGYGEVDDGAFPSLAIASTKILFEEEWLASNQLTEKEAEAILRKKLVGPQKIFLDYVFKLKEKLRIAPKEITVVKRRVIHAKDL